MRERGASLNFHYTRSALAVLFNYDISDNKMNKILDIIDYLLGEEGTRLAIYGKEGTKY